MRYRSLVIAAIILTLSSTILWTIMYGPAKRIFVIPGKTGTAQLAEDINTHWQSSGVHGRKAVIFALYLKQNVADRNNVSIDYLETAIQQGIVRTAYYIVPDRLWSEAVSGMTGKAIKSTDTGFLLLHEGGRIYFMPLSKYLPEEKEQVLAVLDPAVWSSQERFRIDALFSSGLLITDLLVTIGVRE